MNTPLEYILVGIVTLACWSISYSPCSCPRNFNIVFKRKK